MKPLKFLLLLTLLFTSRVVLGTPQCVVVEGHPGDAAFVSAIETTTSLWLEAAKNGGCSVQAVGRASDLAGGSALEGLRAALAAVESPSRDPLWLVLTGHGNAQGHVPRFALRGADLGADELGLLLARVKRPLVIVLGFACSGAFVKPLGGPDRVLVAATRSGEEENWTRFPGFFAEAISGLASDLDGDGQVSVFEAWLSAVDAVEAFYKDTGRLVTEHAVLEDTGNGKAVGRASFDGFGETVKKEGEASVAPVFPGQRARDTILRASPLEVAFTEGERLKRSEWEGELARLRKAKLEMPEGEYRKALEAVFLGLARVYEGVKQRVPSERRE